VTLVDIFDLGQLLHYLGQVSFGKSVARLVEVFVEIGDGIADGHPVRERRVKEARVRAVARRAGKGAFS